MIKKQLLVIFSLFMLCVSVISQVEEKVSTENLPVRDGMSLRDRIVFGADVGLSFGTITYIKLAPTIGYRITERFTSGLGPIYIYYKDKTPNFVPFETSIYGGKIYTSFTIYQGSLKGNRFGIGDVMLHAENEVVNVQKDADNNRLWIDNLLLGAGLFQPISGRFGVSIYVLWDVTQNPYSIYYLNNPVLKFTVNF